MIRTLVATLTALAATAAVAQEMSPAERAHMVRQGLMQNNSFNLGPLVGMARGEMEYDAETAALHAGNLAALSSLNLSPYWVEGSSSEEVEGSRALPAIWEKPDEVAEYWSQLHEAAMALETASGEGQEELAQAVQKVGQACGACHEDFRLSED